MIEVSAGIIRRPDGRVLICQRPLGKHNAGLWEFPGGKVEAGESPEDCLRRELLEELALPVEALRYACRGEAQGFLFHFIEGRTAVPPTLREHQACAFVHSRELLRYPLCPADQAVARRLALTEPPLRHFFWDFDGTLMDTYPAMTEAFCRAVRGEGGTVAEARALALLKESLSHAIGVIASEQGLEGAHLARRFREEEAPLLLRGVPPVEGAPEALRALAEAGGRHYLVTHRDRTSLRMLERAGLMDCFTGWVTGEDGFPRKPAPDSLLHLMARHGTDPAACVMIGDRPLDVQAGRAAGMLDCLLDAQGRFPGEGCAIRLESLVGCAALLCPEGA